jgi:hypothetical protein
MRLLNEIRPASLGITLLALFLVPGSLPGKDKKPKGLGQGLPLDSKKLDGFRMFLEPPEPNPRQIRRIENGRFHGDFRIEDTWERQVAKEDPGKLLDRFFQDPLALDAVRNFESLTVYILPSAKNMSGPNLQERRWLDRSNPAMNLTPEQAKRIAQIYSSPTSYLWGTRFLCGPIYGVRFDFQKGDRQISILLCLTCTHAGIIQNPRKLNNISTEHIHLAEVFPELLEIVKKLAPDNDLIQSLKAPAYTPPADDPVIP